MDVLRRMECQACGMVDVTGPSSHPKAGPGPARRCHGPVIAVEYVPRSELTGAVDALARFGGHFEECQSTRGPDPCDCGWSEAATRYLHGGQ